MPANAADVRCRYIEVEDLRALQGVQDELVEGGLMKPPADSAMAAKGKAKAGKAKRKGRVAPGGEHSKFRRFESPSGLQVLIGRNNHQNDELSTRVANSARLRAGVKHPAARAGHLCRH